MTTLHPAGHDMVSGQEDTVYKKTLCFTGHRKIPGKGYGEWMGVDKAVEDSIQAAYINGFKNFICGGAIGFDTLAATAVLHVMHKYPDMKLIMFIPFKNQPNKWPTQIRDNYFTILSQADKVTYVDEELCLPNVGMYSASKMFIRNKHMVDASDAVMACVSDIATSGSSHCIEYANISGKPVLVLNPTTLQKRWIME